MKTKSARRAVRPAAKLFRVGQIWKIGDVNLAVTSVGKTLVEYKRYTTQPKGVRLTLCSKPALVQLLVKAKAVLATE